MACDKHTWTCDEPITVERLNHIEDGIANAGGGDCGFECEETITLLTGESVTTASDPEYPEEGASARLSYSHSIDAENIKVTFDGTEYECQRTAISREYYYGGITSKGEVDFSEYPFAIIASGSNILVTETEGTHSIKIEAIDVTATTTRCFRESVKSVVDCGFECYPPGETLFQETVTQYYSEEEGRYISELSYNKKVNITSAKVILDGVEYSIVAYTPTKDGVIIGDIDLSQYPFAIEQDNTTWNFYTKTNGSHTLEVVSLEPSVATTPCFASAVESILPCFANVTFAQQSDVTINANSIGDVELYPAFGSQNDIILYAAISSLLYAPSNLIPIGIACQSSDSSSEIVDHFVITYKNSSNTAITVTGLRLVAFCVQVCAEGIL